MPLAHGLLGAAGRAFAARGVGVALSFAVGVVITRSLGAAGAGVYFLAVTLATIAAVVGRLGLDQLLVRRAATARARDEAARIRALGHLGARVAFAASAAAALCLWLAAPALEAYVFPLDGLTPVLRMIALGVLPLSLVTVYAELLRGVSRTGASQLMQVALPPALTLGFLALAVAYVGREPRVAAGAYVAGLGCAALGAALTWRRASRILPRGGPARGPARAPIWSAGRSAGSARELVRAALPFLAVSLLALALSWISMLALALRGVEEDVGIFAVAYRTATLTSLILVAVNAAAAPRFAEMYARSDRSALARGARQAALLTSVCALPLLVAFWAAPGAIMRLFGADFEAGAAALAILATGQFVNVLTGSVGELLMMSGHERSLRGALIATIALSLVLHAILVPRAGVVGAALANAAALVLLNGSALVLVRRRLQIDVLPVFRRARPEGSVG